MAEVMSDAKSQPMSLRDALCARRLLECDAVSTQKVLNELMDLVAGGEAQEAYDGWTVLTNSMQFDILHNANPIWLRGRDFVVYTYKTRMPRVKLMRVPVNESINTKSLKDALAVHEARVRTIIEELLCRIRDDDCWCFHDDGSHFHMTGIIAQEHYIVKITEEQFFALCATRSMFEEYECCGTVFKTVRGYYAVVYLHNSEFQAANAKKFVDQIFW